MLLLFWLWHCDNRTLVSIYIYYYSININILILVLAYFWLFWIHFLLLIRLWVPFLFLAPGYFCLFKFGYITQNSFVIPFYLSILLIWSRKWQMILSVQSIIILLWSYACVFFSFRMSLWWELIFNITSHGVILT